MRAIAWTGAALFAGSLAFFVYFYGVTLGRAGDSSTMGPGPTIVVNVTLFSLFAVHHSLLARSGAKAWIRSIVRPPLERSTYVWVASLLLIAVCALWQPIQGMAWQASGPWRWALHAVQLAGALLVLSSAGIIDSWELAGVRQVMAATGGSRQLPAARPAGIKVVGPYRWLRHPIYLGWMLLVFGVPTMTNGRLLMAAVSSAYLAIAIPFEERSLVEAFGDEYRRYQRQVRARLMPGLW